MASTIGGAADHYYYDFPFMCVFLITVVGFVPYFFLFYDITFNRSLNEASGSAGLTDLDKEITSGAFDEDDEEPDMDQSS